jgi:hypothetical protein
VPGVLGVSVAVPFVVAFPVVAYLAGALRAAGRLCVRPCLIAVYALDAHLISSVFKVRLSSFSRPCERGFKPGSKESSYD